LAVDSGIFDALRALSRFLVADADRDNTITTIVDIAKQCLQGADFVYVSITDESSAHSTVSHSEPRAPEVDQAQYDADRGPCLDAWRLAKVVHLPDVTQAREQYPEFVAAAERHGVKSSLSLPMVAGGSSLGALNLYSCAVGGFREEDMELGSDLAASIAAVLANSQAYWGAHELSDNLSMAMQSRAVIEQAKGILMARDENLDAGGAFEMLRRASQRENIKLRQVAQRIVNRGGSQQTD
jgi:GAF domain-containing protein